MSRQAVLGGRMVLDKIIICFFEFLIQYKELLLGWVYVLAQYIVERIAPQYSADVD
jgi:hypothetical protein